MHRCKDSAWTDSVNVRAQRQDVSLSRVGARRSDRPNARARPSSGSSSAQPNSELGTTTPEALPAVLVLLPQRLRHNATAHMSRRQSQPAAADEAGSSSPERGSSSNALSSLVLPKPHDTLRHMFLQSFITHRLVPHAQAKLMYKGCVKACQGKPSARVWEGRASRAASETRG